MAWSPLRLASVGFVARRVFEQRSKNMLDIPIIALEEHFFSSTIVKANKTASELYSNFPSHLNDKLANTGEGRIQDLDKGKVSLQILSHAPGDFTRDECALGNDELAAAVRKNPGRLAGFAMLPMSDPIAASQELERCVRDLGFVGALVENHVDGVFFDDERFWCVFEKAEQLDVPIYIHPTFASDSMLKHYRGNYSDSVALAMSAFGWGWHTETGHHILRLFGSGMFDRFPKIKIIIGHMGEMLPYQLSRVFIATARWEGRQRSFKEVWDNNIWITTSGMFSLPSLGCLLQVTSMDRVLYSVDYPFSTNETGLQFLEDVQKSGLLTGVSLDKFAYKNAEALLKVKAFT
ncbi:hypothetical protein HDV63DRAFT_387395 [Trichoderma sp. SZMC 28014]